MAQESSSTASTALGTPTQRFEGGSSISNLIGGLFLGVLGVIFLFSAFSIIPSAGSADGFSITYLLLALGLIGLGSYGLHHWWNDRDVYVQVYSDGFTRVQGSKIQEVHWHEISAVWESIMEHEGTIFSLGKSTIGYLYTIETTDHRKLIFSNEIKAIKQFGQIIQNEVTKRLLPSIIDTYNVGQSVTFGELTLSKEGIQFSKKLLSWTEIEGVQVGGGYVGFQKQGKWLSWENVPASTIPNLFVFLALIDHIVGLKRER